MGRVCNYKAVLDTEANKYYYNFGVLLGICYILNAQDLHYENIIASGVYPTIIDLECLFSPPINGEQYNNKNFPSIFQTLLIPFEKGATGGTYDFSALLNHSRQKSIISVNKIKGNYLDKIYIKKDFLNITPTQNYLINKRTKIPYNPSNFTKEITHGFQELLSYIIENRNDIIQIIIREFSSLKNRIIFRPTFLYAKVLMESYHPALLANKSKYFEYLSQLTKKDEDGIKKKIYESELIDLINGDIPYFHTTTTGYTVYNSQDNQVNLNCFETGMERVIYKIKSLAPHHILNMEGLISSSLKECYG